MDTTVKSTALRFGYIIGGIGVAYTLIAYLIDLTLLTTWWTGILFLILLIVLLCVAVGQVKSKMGGYISFKDAFSTFFVAGLVASLISTTVTVLLFNVVDPEAAERLNELTIESTVRTMEKFGAPEEVIDKQVEELQGKNQFSLTSQLWTFLGGLLFYAILGAVVAAIMKKNKPAGFPEEVA
tara:strand:+ start:108 stop:653 length:546 start_codon:yes stop_codon:yes gene_type:complete